MADDRLADVMEEMGDLARIEVLTGLEAERAADLLEIMDPDDAADLLSDLAPERAEALLQLVEPDEAEDLRRLLIYDDATAGGMMNPEPIILPRTPPSPVPWLRSATQTSPQPGRAGLRRAPTAGDPHRALPRRRALPAPAARAAVEPGRRCSTRRSCRSIRRPLLSEVTRSFATYNLVALPVVDPARHLLGAVTVDDVIDHMLPEDWREQRVPEEGNRTRRTRRSRRPAMASSTRRGRARLDQPRERRRSIKPSYDPETFGALSERIARFIGSWTFIAWMTVFIAAWVIWNTMAPVRWRIDQYPFIFLTLLLSLQASCAAPLILLAQNRQTDRDRVQYQEDRGSTELLIADTDFITREMAALREGLCDVVTRDYLRAELRAFLEQLDDDEGAPQAVRRKGT